ncbi:NifU N-terminal domain-containing protein [Paenibacillus bovis]|uniref:Scaffolding protein n=1 Tax=Paenibacillus bovis TaxID=1616788 RepID=A0A172ZDG5_9BACL|nr:NifU N-terminal domain-containing protein [Paenibacillus bovis]ANF95704.1 scaffolding protein [Paenibacillus bovis]
MAIQINVQTTPNPNSVKINADRAIFEGTGSTSVKAGDSTDHAIAQALVNIDGVDNIFGMRDFVTVSKLPDASWDEIMPQVEQIFEEA